MSSLFAMVLTTHIISGVVGVCASYAVLLFLLKRHVNRLSLAWSSFIAFFSYLVSWFSGGYYYVLYYGDNVKPIIKEGAYPWAHLVFMEAKEHLFLALPFSTLALYLVLFYASDRLETNPDLKKSLIILSVTITAIATIITLSGIIISGSA